MGLLIQNQRNPESSPLRSEALTLLEKRRDLIESACGNIMAASLRRDQISTTTIVHDMNQYFRNRMEEMVSYGDAIGRTVGIESTHTPAAAAEVQNLTDSNASLRLEDVVGVPSADDSVEAARSHLLSIHRSLEDTVLSYEDFDRHPYSIDESGETKLNEENEPFNTNPFQQAA